MIEELKKEIMENYLAALAYRVNEFELGLARVVFTAGWDLAIASLTKEKQNEKS